jgi:hypothetical protein
MASVLGAESGNRRDAARFYDISNEVGVVTLLREGRVGFPTDVLISIILSISNQTVRPDFVTSVELPTRHLSGHQWIMMTYSNSPHSGRQVAYSVIRSLQAQLACRRDPRLAHSFLDELATIEAFQLRVFRGRMHHCFGPQVAQQHVALLGQFS